MTYVEIILYYNIRCIMIFGSLLLPLVKFFLYIKISETNFFLLNASDICAIFLSFSRLRQKDSVKLKPVNHPLSVQK